MVKPILVYAIILLAFLYPLVLGYLPSPNDVFYHYDPWRSESPVLRAWHPGWNDPPTAYWPRIAFLKKNLQGFFWNPYLAGGYPGSIDVASGVLNISVLLLLLAPLWSFYLGMLIFKITVSFWGMVALTRGWGYTKTSQGVAGLLFTLGASHFLWIFWPQTNGTIWLPWALFLIDKAMAGGFRWYHGVLTCLATQGILGCGYPPFALIMGLIILTYGVSQVPWRKFPLVIKKMAPWWFMVLLLYLPSIYLFWKNLAFLGYLPGRASYLWQPPLPWKHLFFYFLPFPTGNPIYGTFQPLQGFPSPGNFQTTAAYMGPFTLLPLLLGFLKVQGKKGWWLLSWIGFIIVGAYAFPGLRHLISWIPGFAYIAFDRFLPFLLFFIALFVGRGFSLLDGYRNLTPLAFVALLLPLLYFDLTLLPYQPIDQIIPSTTPGVVWLKNHAQPYDRILPLFDSLWPNASAWLELEDLRAHFTSERHYREALKKTDPSSPQMGSFLLFWDKIDLSHPLWELLHTRYLLENPAIHVVRKTILKHQEVFKPNGRHYGYHPHLGPLTLTFRSEKPIYAFSLLPCTFLKKDIPGTMTVTLKTATRGILLHKWEIAGEKIRDNKPLWFFPKLVFGGKDQVLSLTIEGSFSQPISLWQTDASWCQATQKDVPIPPPAITLHHTPWFLVYEGRDLRIYENLALPPPFRLVWRIAPDVALSGKQAPHLPWMEPRAFNLVQGFLEETPGQPTGEVTIQSIDPWKGKLLIKTRRNALLLTPLKYRPDYLKAKLDGQPIQPIQLASVVSGFLIPKGTHTFSFSWSLW